MSVTPSRLVVSIVGVVVALATLCAWVPAAPSALAAAAHDPLRIVVLGDSYTAGNGAGDYYGPAGCKRSRRNWVELYAEALRAQGRTVSVTNHACSGALVADLLTPRTMETSQRSVARPAGLPSLADAQAWLDTHDPCNTQANPGEEYWTYLAKALTITLDYSCTRMLPAQNSFVNGEADLVVLALGGNDVGFTDIVKQCFVVGLRSPNGCRNQVTLARTKLPTIRTPLLAGLADLRRRGLRPDARIVQIGYPMLQVDNDFRLDALGQESFRAAVQVRALGRDGVTDLAGAISADNAAFPGQASFLAGVPETFAGHEPDAARGNAEAWVVQAFSTGDYMEWYHPNPAGHARLAALMAQQVNGIVQASAAQSPGPTTNPTFMPSPTDKPTFSPTYLPTYLPSSKPTVQPTTQPTTQPTQSTSASASTAPTSTAGPTPGTDPGTSVRLPSTTVLAVRRPARPGGKWRVIVRVRATGTAVNQGQVRLVDAGRVLATGRLSVTRPGVVVFKVRLGAGKHRLTARYLGISTIAASASAPLKVRRPRG